LTSELKQKSVVGVFWSLFERFGNQGIKFLLGIILARLLTPKDFGLIGMITVFFAIAQTFVQSGFGQAYVQKKNVTDIDSNTIFYTNLLISLVLYAVLWISAPAIARFYEQIKLIEITRVMGLVVIINAFNVIQIAQIKRDINFKRKTKVNLFSTLTGGVLGIIAAIKGLGVWSLVIQQMASRFITTIGFWITSNWQPSLKFSRSAFKSMFSYGSWLLASSIIGKIFQNIYILAIGKFFPAAEVGLYTKSRQFQKLATKEFIMAISSVAFPVFSQLQDNKEKLKNGMQKFLQHTLGIILPVVTVLILVAKPLIILLLTEKWASMIPYFRLLLIVGFFLPFKVMNFQVLKAQGRSDLSFKLSLVFNGLRLLNIAINYQAGVIYIILGEVIISFLSIFIASFFTRSMVGYGIFQQLFEAKEIIIGAIISGIIGFLTITGLENLWLILFIGSIVTITIYLLIQFIFNKSFFMEVVSLKKQFRKGR
jgi:O-antigen/teichoic acid export membrane protein